MGVASLSLPSEVLQGSTIPFYTMSYFSSSGSFRKMRSTALGKPVSALFRVSTTDYTPPSKPIVRRRRGRSCLNALTGRDLTVVNTVAAVRRGAFDVLVRQFPLKSDEGSAIFMRERRGVARECSYVWCLSPPVTGTTVAGMPSVRSGVGAFKFCFLCMQLKKSTCSIALLFKGYLILPTLLICKTQDVLSSTLSKSCQASLFVGRPPTFGKNVERIISGRGVQYPSDRLLNFAVAIYSRFSLRPTARVNASGAYPVSLPPGFVNSNAGIRYVTDSLMYECVRFCHTGAVHSRTTNPSGGATRTTVGKSASTVHSASLIFHRGSPENAASRPCKLLFTDENTHIPGKVVNVPSSSGGSHDHGELVPAKFVRNYMSSSQPEKPASFMMAAGTVPLRLKFTGERALWTDSRNSVGFFAQECRALCGVGRRVSGLDRQIPFHVMSSKNVHTNEGFSCTPIWRENYSRSCETATTGVDGNVDSPRPTSCLVSLRESSLPPRSKLTTTAGRLSVSRVNYPFAFNEGPFTKPARAIPMLYPALDKKRRDSFLCRRAPPSVSPCSLSDREDLVLTEIRVNVLPDATEKAPDTERALDRLVTRVLRHSKHRHHPRHMLHIHHNKHRYRQWFQKPCKTSTGIHLGSKKSGKR